MGKKNSNVIPLHTAATETSLLEMNRKIKSLKLKHKKTCEMAARAILCALNLKDHYTFGHSTRVAFFSLVVGKKLGLTKSELYDLELASLFHDIGKIGTPDSLLNKPQRLEPEEFAIVQQHPQLSYKILEEFPDFEKIAIYARHHHERFDGQGYPDQLKGAEIPFFSRIILISDTFDSMTSTRPYREGMTYQTAFDELRQFSGSQFDPQLVEVFVEAMTGSQQKNNEIFELSIIEGRFRKNAA